MAQGSSNGGSNGGHRSAGASSSEAPGLGGGIKGVAVVQAPGGVLKTAFVGGASKGIGRAVARHLASRGIRVIACGRSEADLKNLIDELPLIEVKGATHLDSELKTHKAFVCDLSNTTELEGQLKKLVLEMGAVDVLILNSGGPKGGPILEASPQEFRDAMEGHLVANQILCKTYVPGMKSRGGGRIVAILSTSVRQPIPGLGVSNATRWAMAAWAKTLAGELAPHAITVNLVLPGFTKTGRLDELAAAGAAKRGITEEQVRDEWIKSTPMARLGEPEEIAAAVAFFASPAASFITGQALAVDGGRLGSV
jgi:3-oxoacyl-[acyl-carrier protein] reductase